MTKEHVIGLIVILLAIIALPVFAVLWVLWAEFVGVVFSLILVAGLIGLGLQALWRRLRA